MLPKPFFRTDKHQTPCTVDVTTEPYNAVGDQVTDSTAAIQQAIIDVSSIGGGIVWIPAGIYLITATIRHRSNVLVQGCGSSSIILVRKASSTPAWTFRQQSRAQLCNLVIRTENPIDAIDRQGYTGLELSQSFFNHIHHIQIWDFNRGIVMSDGTPFSAYNVIGPEVEVNRCCIGIRAWANCNACMITGSRVFGNLNNVDIGRASEVGLDIEDAIGLTVIGTTIEPAETCMRVRGESPRCHFIGNYFEPGGLLGSVDLAFLQELEQGILSPEFQQALDALGIPLSGAAMVVTLVPDSQWQIDDQGHTYLVRVVGGALNLYPESFDSRLVFDINVPDSTLSTAVVRGEGNAYEGNGLARLPTSGPHYWDGNSSGSFGAFYSGAAAPKRNLVRNGDLKYWGGFPNSVPNWFVVNNPILSEELSAFVTGNRSVRITQNIENFEGLGVRFMISDPGIHWVTVGCRYQVLSGTEFFFGANALGEAPRQFADSTLSNGEWKEGFLQVPIPQGATIGEVRLIPSTGGEVLIDEVWAVPGRFSVESTQYGERVELLESPLPILSQAEVASNEVQGPIDITDLPAILAPSLAGLAAAPPGVVGCLLRVRIETLGVLTLLDNFHYAYIDIPGDAIVPAQIHRVYSHWGQQPNEEIIVVRTTQITGGYQAGDNLISSYTWHLVGWILA